jgi:hypothetical protein
MTAEINGFQAVVIVDRDGDEGFGGSIEQAIREIESGYGDIVSVVRKEKSLLKFGRTSNADVGVKTTVATFQDAVVNETFATTNSIDKVVSSSGSDTGVVTVEGHTLNTENGHLTFAVQNVILTGQTAATLATPLARCTRIYRTRGTFASPSTDLVGNVVVYDSTLSGGGLSSGKPDVDESVKCIIPAGKNQSEKCATSISSTDYWILTSFYTSCTRNAPQNARVDIDIEWRELGGVWRPLGLEITIDQAVEPSFGEVFKVCPLVPKNSDVRMVATSNTADTIVTGRMHGLLAEIVS